MSILQSYEREIFKDLFKSNKPLDFYYFHEKYQLSPAQIFVFMEDYSTEGIIIRVDNKIQLTKKGRHFIWQKRLQLSCDSNSKTWRPPIIYTDWRDPRNVTAQNLNHQWIDKRINQLEVKRLSVKRKE